MQKMGKLGEPSWRIVFYFSLLGAIFSFIGQWVFSDGFHFPSPHGALCILGIGVFATLGQIFMTRAYAYGNLLLSSCLGFSAIPFSAIFGFFIFDDPITVRSLIAMSLAARVPDVAGLREQSEKDGGNARSREKRLSPAFRRKNNESH